MEKYKAIPQGYITAGTFAKKMNTTVRTLQYYDKEGLLSPSAVSEGGRRLYTDKDMVKLHQILSMKYLGFSLDDIKERLISLDTPNDVAGILTEQAEAIRKKINFLSETLQATEILKAEVLQMKTVNFKKYADIVVLLQMKNNDYWVIKHFDDKMLEHIRNHFDEQSAKEMVNTWNRLCDETAELKKNGVCPNSEQGKAIAKEWWEMITNFTHGDMSLLPELIKFGENTAGWDEKWKEKWSFAETYIKEALEAYFADLNYNPLEGVQ